MGCTVQTSAVLPRLGLPRSRDGWGRRLALAPVLEPVHDHDLDRSRNRNSTQRTEDPGDLGADQHRDEHHQRRELHGARIHDRLQEVVLDLLVDDEEDDDDDPGHDRLDERDRADDEPPHRFPPQPNQLGALPNAMRSWIPTKTPRGTANGTPTLTIPGGGTPPTFPLTNKFPVTYPPTVL